MLPFPSRAEIEAAAALIRPQFGETPLYRRTRLETHGGAEVWIKHENHTPVGAFKIRGGIVYLDELLRAQPDIPGVIAASTGNHGQSIAWSARHYGKRAVIVVPQGNNPDKNAAMRGLGADLVEHGEDFQSALEHSRELASREGLHAVPSFHPTLVRGVATCGYELFRARPDLDAVFVPIGLGSGFCGLAAARAALGVKTEIIGVVSAHAPAYELSFRQGQLVDHASSTRVAEGVACRTPNAEAFELIRHHAADVVTVTDDEAVAAMGELLHTTQQLAEGAGALAWAAFAKQAEQWQGKRVACILSGGNASRELIRRAAMA